MSMADLADELESAVSSSEAVSLDRGTLDRERAGHLLAYSAQFLYLTVVDDSFRLDGYQVLSRSEIRAASTDSPRSQLLRAALALHGVLKPERFPAVDLSDMRSVLKSVESTHSVVVIERERLHPGECEIGRLKLMSDDRYSLRWLSPSAVWEHDARTFRYSDITRVAFGGRYETTLAELADRAS
jgi:hypothetical protein